MKEPYITADISGFGGEYENECQKMLKAGIDAMESFPYDADDDEVFDILEKVLLKTTPDCTGAMMGATIRHAFYIYKNGYEKWLDGFEDDRKYLYPDNLPPEKFLEDKKHVL